MKLTIQSSELASMVSVCSMAISARPMRPINECVYLAARQGDGIPMLTCIGKDSGLCIQKVTDKTTVIEDGDALIPAKTLLNFVKLMEDEVTLTVDDKLQATLKCRGKKVNISCMDGAEFEPGLTQIVNANEVRINGSDYGKLVDGVACCVSEDTGRMVLTGINFAFDGGKPTNGAEAVGMDGPRMACARGGVETNDVFSAIIPSASAKLVEKVIKDAEDVSFRFGKGVMIAEAYDTAVEVSLLSGQYVDYKSIISKLQPTMRVKLSTENLLNAVRMAMISASEGKKGLVTFTFKGEEILEVSAMADKSASVTDVPCMVEGQLAGAGGGSQNKINFNGKYLEEALSVIKGYGSETVLHCEAGTKPMVLTPADRDDYYQLVLPVRQM